MAPAPEPAPASTAPIGDVVTIRNLRAWTLIGVHAHEREARQEIRIDVGLWTDTRPAAASDDVADTIDYASVARAYREHAGRASHQLVETLAEEFAAMALEHFGAHAVQISVEKPGAVPGADAVGVTILRRADAGAGGDA